MNNSKRTVASNSVTDGGWGANRPPGKPNAKPDSHFAYVSVFSILLVFTWLFFTFFGVLFGEFGFLYIHPHPGLLSYLNYFLNVGQWAPVD